MTYDGNPEPDSGLYMSSAAADPQRSARRRKQAIVGVAGAAAVLAGAGFLVTQLINDNQPRQPEPAALAPMTSPAVTESVPAPAPVEPSITRTPKATRHAAPVRISPVPPPPPSFDAIPEPAEAAATAAVEGMLGAHEEIHERTEALGAGTLRIVSARRDLTGERLTLLSRDQGRAVGQGVRCTSEMRFGTGLPPAAPGILVCWRTSEYRSVITIGPGSATAESVAAINREWLSLG
ncbi:hypothetical protein [Actinoplanes sp. G11-F43]|uniref:hypothetical protein n=1 Tax=Actinoplanes sp. G11-F43 TaxID=3424130 RepID=UPI003D32B3DD